jgi:hypothetical protein
LNWNGKRKSSKVRMSGMLLQQNVSWKKKGQGGRVYCKSLPINAFFFHRRIFVWKYFLNVGWMME